MTLLKNDQEWYKNSHEKANWHYFSPKRLNNDAKKSSWFRIGHNKAKKYQKHTHTILPELNAANAGQKEYDAESKAI